MTTEFGALPQNEVPAFRTREIAAAIADVECGEELRAIKSEAVRTHLQTLSPESYDQLYP